MGRDRRRVRGWIQEWQFDMLEAAEDQVDLLTSANYYLSLIAPRLRLATQVSLSFIGTNPPKFFPVGSVIIINDLQSVLATLTASDSNDNPTTLDPSLSPVWSTDNTILTVTPAANGLTAVVSATGKLGTALVTVVAGTMHTQAVFQITVSAATKIVISYASQQGEQHMPLTLTDVQSDTATATVVDAAGNPVPPNPDNPNKIAYAVDDATVCSVTDNGDGTASLKALKPGTANLTASDNSGDAPDTEVITVTGSAGRLVISFGTPA